MNEDCSPESKCTSINDLDDVIISCKVRNCKGLGLFLKVPKFEYKILKRETILSLSDKETASLSILFLGGWLY